jgi:hypothetical protein
MTLWDYAELATTHEIIGNVLIDEKVKRGKLVALCEVLTDCEVFVYRIFEDLDYKKALGRLFNLKIFGSFEQLRTEMELRYPKTEQVFLKAQDHTTIHGYWIPYNQTEDSETDITAPTMILCGPNAEQAEMI